MKPKKLTAPSTADIAQTMTMARPETTFTFSLALLAPGCAHLAQQLSPPELVGSTGLAIRDDGSAIFVRFISGRALSFFTAPALPPRRRPRCHPPSRASLEIPGSGPAPSCPGSGPSPPGRA